MLDAQFFRFSDGSLQPCTDSVADVQLITADSFLVEDGRTRSLGAHESRFLDWSLAAFPQLDGLLPSFFAAVHSAIPRTGRWFPRIELHADSHGHSCELFLRLRPAPEQLGQLTLWTLDEPDPRQQPRVKGPDLSLCMQLRRRAQLHLADEAAILDERGYLVEGALSAIVWWRGDVLCAPDNQTAWLPSVTREEVFALAKSLGYATRLEHVKPADLVGTEVWALSSLQGIRHVDSWVGLGSPLGAATHLDKFQKRLRMLATAID